MRLMRVCGHTGRKLVSRTRPYIDKLDYMLAAAGANDDILSQLSGTSESQHSHIHIHNALQEAGLANAATKLGLLVWRVLSRNFGGNNRKVYDADDVYDAATICMIVMYLVYVDALGRDILLS